MALPMNATPVYNLIIPSSKKEYKYRPFLVKEEKALLMAQQSEEMSVIADTIRDVIKSCCKNTVDIDALTYFDVEYIFLKLRCVSVGETIEIQLDCDADHEETSCKSVISLDKAYVDTPKDHTNNIVLYDNVGIVFNYPSIDTVKKLSERDQKDMNVLFDFIAENINYIYSGDEIFKREDHTKEELVEFLNNLQSKQFENVQKFFSTMPVVKVKASYTCSVCNKTYEKEIAGLTNFF